MSKTKTEKVLEFVAELDEPATIKTIAEYAGCTVARVREVCFLEVEEPLLRRADTYGYYEATGAEVVGRPRASASKPKPTKETYESVMAALDAGKDVDDAAFEAARQFAKAKRRKLPMR